MAWLLLSMMLAPMLTDVGVKDDDGFARMDRDYCEEIVGSLALKMRSERY
jgi:hypothetical protein